MRKAIVGAVLLAVGAALVAAHIPDWLGVWAWPVGVLAFLIGAWITARDQRRRYWQSAVDTLQNLSDSAAEPNRDDETKRGLDDLARSLRGGRSARKRVKELAQSFKQIPPLPRFGLHSAADQNAALAVHHGTATPEQQARIEQLPRDVLSAEQQREKVVAGIGQLREEFGRKLGR